MSFVELFILSCIYQLIDSSKNEDETNEASKITSYFLDNLMGRFGSNKELYVDQMQHLLDVAQKKDSHHVAYQIEENSNGYDRLYNGTYDFLNTSKKPECLSAAELLALYNWNGTINSAELQQFTPGLLYQATLQHCNNDNKQEETLSTYTQSEVWGYGMLSITVVVGSGLLACLIFICVANPHVYAILLMTMVSLAVGVLTGMGFLFLIPEALQLSENYDKGEYIWKLTCVAGGLYFLVIFERIIKVLKHAKQHRIKQVNSNTKLLVESPTKEQIAVPEGMKSLRKEQVDSVAWVLILGDALHNFVDGIAVGAGFAQSILTGVGLSVCIICEHVPHKVGDFAILVNAGMSVKQAALYTVLAGTMCYLGLTMGILVGELTDATSWILALAAGIFLYIGLVDMLPEICEKVDDEKTVKGQLKIFALQNLGILAGYSIMIIVALYASDISFE